MAADDDAQFARISQDLADALVAALPGWVERQVRSRVVASGGTMDDSVAAQAAAAGQICAATVGPALRALLATDPDEQRTTPLTLVRDAVRYPTEVLVHAGVTPAVRDEFEQRVLPDDLYGLAPATFADIDENLAEIGLVWGAAKAHVHLARRRELDGAREIDRTRDADEGSGT